jgi:hypothetical protein
MADRCEEDRSLEVLQWWGISEPSDRLKNGVFLDVTLCGSLRTDVLEELSASFVRARRIDELGTTLAVTSNRHMLRKNTICVGC